MYMYMYMYMWPSSTKHTCTGVESSTIHVSSYWGSQNHTCRAVSYSYVGLLLLLRSTCTCTCSCLIRKWFCDWDFTAIHNRLDLHVYNVHPRLKCMVWLIFSMVKKLWYQFPHLLGVVFESNSPLLLHLYKVVMGIKMIGHILLGRHAENPLHARTCTHARTHAHTHTCTHTHTHTHTRTHSHKHITMT